MRSNTCKILKAIHSVTCFCVLVVMAIVASFKLINSVSHKHRHRICVPHSINIFLLFRSSSLKFFKNTKSWRNVGFAFFEFTDEFGKGYSKLFPYQCLLFLRKLSVNLIPKKVKISLFFLKLFTNEVEFVS